MNQPNTEVTTPRTDARNKVRADIFCEDGHRKERWCVELDFARQLERELTAAIAELDALRAEREWRDISTAPRDGTVILLWSCGKCVTAAWGWEDYYERKKDWMYGDTRSEYGDRDIAYSPTHWQPLPAPPMTNPSEQP